VDERTYLIRFGAMSQVGRFAALPDCAVPFERGHVVVIQSHRGLELGEVLLAHDAPSQAPASAMDAPPASHHDQASRVDGRNHPHVLRLADHNDLARSERAQTLRSSRFTVCQRVLADSDWPGELIDVEPLLDDRATVLHYLGPHDLDIASLRARFRVDCDLDVVLEPFGADLAGSPLEEHSPEAGGHGGCGSCDCGAGGGCGSTSASGPPQHEEHAAASSGCSSCAISRLMSQRRRQPV
jgi:hypothetical protein